MTIMFRSAVLTAAALMLMAFIGRSSPASAEERPVDNAAAKPCNSLCRQWMAWGGIEAGRDAPPAAAVDLHPDLRLQQSAEVLGDPQPVPITAPRILPAGKPVGASRHPAPSLKPNREARTATPALPASRPRHPLPTRAAQAPAVDAVRLVEAEVPPPESAAALVTIIAPPAALSAPQPVLPSAEAEAPPVVPAFATEAPPIASASPSNPAIEPRPVAQASVASSPTPTSPPNAVTQFPPAFDVIAAIMLGSPQGRPRP